MERILCIVLFLLILPMSNVIHRNGFRKAFHECTARKIYFLSLSLSPHPNNASPASIPKLVLSLLLIYWFIFFCPAHNLMKYVGLKHVRHSKNWGAVDTPYRCWQAMELNKSFFKSMPHQRITKRHRTYSLFFYKEGRKIIFSIIIELFGME